MQHLHDDLLLLVSYGELAEPDAGAAHAHLAACPECRARLERFERARVAVEWSGLRARRAPARWIALAAAAAAVLAAVLLLRAAPDADPVRGPLLTPVWSPNAGYIAGGAAVIEIDAQLTRLEQERYDALPD